MQRHRVKKQKQKYVYTCGYIYIWMYEYTHMYVCTNVWYTWNEFAEKVKEGVSTAQ